MTRHTEPLTLGYGLSLANIQPTVWPVIDETTERYTLNHPNLQSVYVIGSIALGELKDGISDLDVVGVTVGSVDEAADAKRRRELVEVGDSWDIISFIDNSAVDDNQLTQPKAEQLPLLQGYASKLALTGLCVWGRASDYSANIPTVGEMAYGRTERVVLLMRKYRDGNLIEPFRRDERLLVRSCVKAAIRAISGVTILRGAPYHSSPYRTVEEVGTYAPELASIADEAITVLDNPTVPVEDSMDIADRAVSLFYRLHPLQSD